LSVARSGVGGESACDMGGREPEAGRQPSQFAGLTPILWLPNVRLQST